MLSKCRLPLTVSRSMRAIRASGKSRCSSSSTFSEPVPMKFRYSLPHFGQTEGTFCGVVAVVAQHAAVAPVIGERDRAIDAFQSLATRAARDEARKSAAVEQQHGLLAMLQAFGDGLHQPARKRRQLARLQELLPHVDHFDVRHGPLLDALRKFDQRVLAALGVVAALQTGRRRAKHQPPRPTSRARTMATSRPL